MPALVTNPLFRRVRGRHHGRAPSAQPIAVDGDGWTAHCLDEQGRKAAETKRGRDRVILAGAEAPENIQSAGAMPSRSPSVPSNCSAARPELPWPQEGQGLALASEDVLKRP